MRAAIDPDDADEPLFFDTLLEETCTPIRIAVGDLKVTFEVPDGGMVGELDDTETDVDVLEVLLVPTDEDEGPDPRDEVVLDELLDALEHRPARELRNLVDHVLRGFTLHRQPPQGWRHLVDTLDRFGPGIEWDLLTAGGLRLHDFLRDPDRHPWALLYRVLAYLPQGGGYWSAVQDDEQWAHDLIDAEEKAKARGEKPPKPSTRPALFGWTAQAERDTAILDALRQGVHATWGASPKFKGKGGRPPGSLPRPRNAVARVRRQRSMVDHEFFVDALLPRGYEPPPDDLLVAAYRDDAEPRPRNAGLGQTPERIPSPEAVRGGVFLDLPES